MDAEVQIRVIKKNDNLELAEIIREVLTEFGANKPGTVYYDVSTDTLFELFQQENAVYFVAEENGALLGGCGIFPTVGLPEHCAELVKLYLSAGARGKGIGKRLILKCFAEAKKMGFDSLYLESLPELSQAIALYEKLGFTYLTNSLGESGHFGCDVWMLKDLSDTEI